MQQLDLESCVTQALLGLKSIYEAAVTSAIAVREKSNNKCCLCVVGEFSSSFLTCLFACAHAILCRLKTSPSSRAHSRRRCNMQPTHKCSFLCLSAYDFAKIIFSSFCRLGNYPSRKWWKWSQTGSRDSIQMWSRSTTVNKIQIDLELGNKHTHQVCLVTKENLLVSVLLLGHTRTHKFCPQSFFFFLSFHQASIVSADEKKLREAVIPKVVCCIGIEIPSSLCFLNFLVFVWGEKRSREPFFLINKRVFSSSR